MSRTFEANSLARSAYWRIVAEEVGVIAEHCAAAGDGGGDVIDLGAVCWEDRIYVFGGRISSEFPLAAVMVDCAATDLAGAR